MSRRKKINITLAVINAVLLAAAGIIVLRIDSIKNTYSSDSAKQLWDGEKYNYSQISMYLPPENGMDAVGVYSMRESVKAKLKESSILDSKDNPPGRLWIDCSEAMTDITVKGSMGSCEAAVSGTFGDYFIFHPEPIMYGSYYTSDDTNFDRIILDKECSWKLFGAVDTVGMPITVNNMTFYVAAVTDTPDSGRDRAAYGDKPRVYMPFEALKILYKDSALTTYEVCMPNAVRDYALDVIKDIDPAKDRTVITDQSGRFDIISLIRGGKDIYKSVMVRSNIALPWYENRTRAAELQARMTAAPLPYLLLVPAFSLVYLIFMFVKLLGAGVRKAAGRAEERYQQKITEEYRQRQENK